MNEREKRALADSDEQSDSTATQLNTDITENLKSLPRGSLGPREKRRLRKALEREHAAAGDRRSSFFDFLCRFWRGSR